MKHMSIGHYSILREDDGRISVYCKFTNLTYWFSSIGLPLKGSPNKQVKAVVKAFIRLHP